MANHNCLFIGYLRTIEGSIFDNFAFYLFFKLIVNLSSKLICLFMIHNYQIGFAPFFYFNF